jgi:8-oxo-dGTP diphosphatase
LASHETDEQAARRELREELDLKVDAVLPAIFEIRDPGSNFVIAFIPTSVSGTPQAREHDVIAWHTLDELRSVALAPSDREFVKLRLSQANTDQDAHSGG